MSILTTFQRLNPKQQRSLLLLLGTGCFFWISLTTLLPTLPTYLADLGGTKAQIGLVMGSFAIGLLCSRTWLGHLADTHSRKIVLYIGIFVAGIAPFGYWLIPSVFPLIAVRAVHGISIAAFTTGYSALVVDLSPAKYRGELIGYMSLVAPIGMGIGPALGGFLQESYGYGPLFLTSASFGFFGLLLVGWIPETPRYHEAHQEVSLSVRSQRSFRELLASRSLMIPALILLLIGLLFGILVTFLPLFLRETNLGLSAGLFYTVAAIASFSARILSGQASDRYGRGLFITGSLFCYFLSMLFLTQAKGPEGLLLAAIFEGMGGGILIPMIIALISDRSFSQERGRVYSVCLSGFDVGIAIAGPVIGSLGSFLSYPTIFTLSSSLAVIAIILFMSQSNKSWKTSLSFALGKERDLYAVDG
ncbi:MFS transporter [Crocosphaera sp. UHCC 0190]|uniref:MFS transporter n=1 Tax=Crocosphaera sp. UHCC 0190 TaxID=3110246 RepID=UPI002B1EABFB|nr:MFS transporter [Crocosphaera sp. UHCC 0190]MEA5510571.1 MFS transporter [Crocosphaera sp. UHCC 0190]